MEENKLAEIFEKYDDEYGQFEKIEKKLSNRPDLHAFILLDSILPGSGDIVSAADHDVIYLDANIEDFGAKATEEQILELVRCGVMYDWEEAESLKMWV